jgi:hypothetical protein
MLCIPQISGIPSQVRRALGGSLVRAKQANKQKAAEEKVTLLLDWIL